MRRPRANSYSGRRIITERDCSSTDQELRAGRADHVAQVVVGDRRVTTAESSCLLKKPIIAYPHMRPPPFGTACSWRPRPANRATRHCESFECWTHDRCPVSHSGSAQARFRVSVHRPGTFAWPQVVGAASGRRRRFRGGETLRCQGDRCRGGPATVPADNACDEVRSRARRCQRSNRAWTRARSYRSHRSRRHQRLRRADRFHDGNRGPPGTNLPSSYRTGMAHLTDPSVQRNRLHGAMAAWYLPAAWPTSPATVQRVRWKARTPTATASSEVRTICPCPVRARSCAVVRTP